MVGGWSVGVLVPQGGGGMEPNDIAEGLLL